MATGPIHLEVIPGRPMVGPCLWRIPARPFPLKGFRHCPPVRLQAPAFGRPDPELARMVCASIESVMPPTAWRAPRQMRAPDRVIDLAGWSIIAAALCGVASAAVRL